MGTIIRNGRSYGGSVPTATVDTLGIVKPDNNTITIDADGTLHGNAKVTIDAELDENSENAIQNKAVAEALENVEIDVDDALSKESTNPVQNKIITEKVVESKLVFNDKSVAVDAFVEDSTYEKYPFKAEVACSGVTADYIPNVIFSADDAVSGLFAPVTATAADKVIIYATEAPQEAITIPTIICDKAVTV